MTSTVAHVIETMGMGGAEQLLRAPLGQLTAFEHLIVVLRQPVVRQGVPYSTRIICLNQKSNLPTIASVYRLRKILNRYDVDLVHSHLYWATLLARLCARRRPLISTVHSMLFDPATGDAKFRYPNLARWVELLTARRTTSMIFVSNAVCGMYRSRISRNAPKRVIGNYVNNVFYERRRTRSPGSITHISCVANLKPEKNHSLLLKAMTFLSSSDFCLTLAGDGPLRDELAEFASENGLQNVVFLGAGSDIAALLAETDIYVSASRFEGFGIAVAEALAMGLPCIVSDIPAHREVAQTAAVFFDPTDPVDLSKAITTLSGDGEKRDSLANLSAFVARGFRIDNYVEHTRRLYNTLLGSTES